MGCIRAHGALRASQNFIQISGGQMRIVKAIDSAIQSIRPTKRGGGVSSTTANNGFTGYQRTQTPVPDKPAGVIPEQPVEVTPDIARLAEQAVNKRKLVYKQLSGGSAGTGVPAIPDQKEGRVLVEAEYHPGKQTYHQALDEFFGDSYPQKQELKDAIAAAFQNAAGRTKAEEHYRHSTRLAAALAASVGTGWEGSNDLFPVQVMSCLRHMNLADMARNAGHGAIVDNSSPEVREAAWRLAYELASTTNGYETLRQVTQISDDDSLTLKNFLDTACHMAEALPKVKADPASLLEHATTTNKRTLLGDALCADHMLLQGRSWTEVATSHPMLACATTAVRSGFDTDAPGSPLDRLRKRSEKLPKLVDAAVKRYNDGSRLPVAGNFLAPFSRRPSPVMQVLEHGIRNLHDGALAVAADMPHALGALEGGLDEKIRICSLRLDEAGNTPPAPAVGATGRLPEHAPGPQELHAGLADSLVKQAIVKAWNARGVMQRSLGLELQPHELDWVRQQLRKLEQGSLNLNMNARFIPGELESRFDQSLSQVRLTPDTLDEWAKGAVDFPGREESASTHKLPEWFRQYSDSIREIKGDARKGGLPERIDSEDALRYIQSVYDGLTLGAVATGASGRTAGIHTSNYVSNLLRAMTAGQITPTARGEFTRTKEETVTLGIQAPGVVFGYGEQRKGFKGGELGARVPVASAALGASVENVLLSGLLIRGDRVGGLPTVGYRTDRGKGMAGDPELREEFGRNLVNALLRPLSDEDRRRGLKTPADRLMAEHPELSFTWINKGDVKQKTRRVSGQAGAGISLDLAKWNFGGKWTISMHRTHQPEHRQHYEEKTGRVRCVRDIAHLGFGVRVQAGAEGPGNLFSIPISIPASASADVAAGFTTVQRNLTYLDGAVDPTSYMMITHRRAEDFARAVLARLDDWAVTVVNRRLSTVPLDQRPAAGTEQHDALMDEGRESVRRFVQQVLDRAIPIETFNEWSQLNPDAADRINSLLTNAKLAHKAGKENVAQTAEKAANTIANDPASWSPILLFTLETQKVETRRGLPNVVAVFNAGEAYTTTNVRLLDG